MGANDRGNIQDMLRDEGEGIHSQVCRKPDLKWAVLERVYRTVRDRIYKYFTHKNIYRYIDVLPIFIKAYNDTVHSTTCLASSRVTDSDVLAIWKRMEAAQEAFALLKQRRIVWGSKFASGKRRCGLPKLQNRISARRFSGSPK